MGTFASDTFTAANGTPINGRTADSGGTWSIPSWGVATGAIQNNRAYGGNTFSAFSLSDTAGSANYDVSCDLVYTGFGGINLTGVYGRMTSGNGYSAYRDGNSIDLYRYDAGSATLLGTVARTYENCNIRLSMLGSQISVFVVEAASGNYVKSDGTTQAGQVACISVTDATHSSVGFPGMYLNNSLATTRLHIDNFIGSEAEIYEEDVETEMSLSSIALVKAFRRPLYFNSTRIARLPDNEYIEGTPPSLFLDVSLTDFSDGTYYYYGGLDEEDNWQINRYLKADLTSKRIANETINGAYTTLSAAWAARGSLVYA